MINSTTSIVVRVCFAIIGVPKKLHHLGECQLNRDDLFEYPSAIDTYATAATLCATNQMLSLVRSGSDAPKQRGPTQTAVQKMLAATGLTEVRHERGQNWVKSFRISSGNRRVYTTFAIEFEVVRERETELIEQ